MILFNFLCFPQSFDPYQVQPLNLSKYGFIYFEMWKALLYGRYLRTGKLALPLTLRGCLPGCFCLQMTEERLRVSWWQREVLACALGPSWALLFFNAHHPLWSWQWGQSHAQCRTEGLGRCGTLAWKLPVRILTCGPKSLHLFGLHLPRSIRGSSDTVSKVLPKGTL